jgi:hypothetical protein
MIQHSSSASLQKTEKQSRGKNEQIVDGFRRLAARQKPGQTFSQSEIARECNVHKRSIAFLERKAQYNFAKRLHDLCPELLGEIFKDRPVTELLAGLSPDPYRTGKMSGRNSIAIAAQEREAKRRATRIQCDTTLTEITEILEKRNTAGNWKSPASRKARTQPSLRLDLLDCRSPERIQATELVQRGGGVVRPAA